MAETKQISATIDQSLADWIYEEAKSERRTISQIIEILLEEAKTVREKMREK